MIPVVLSWGEKSIRTLMLLDSGATKTFLMPWMARRLGLDIEAGVNTANGAGGTIDTKRAKVRIRLDKHDTHGQDGRDREMPVLVTVKEDAIPFGVIGRSPFFDWYEITFFEREERLRLREIREK